MAEKYVALMGVCRSFLGTRLKKSGAMWLVRGDTNSPIVSLLTLGHINSIRGFDRPVK